MPRIKHTQPSKSHVGAAQRLLKGSGFIDSFDAVRLTMLSTKDEHRAVIAGIPWYLTFQTIGNDGIMRIPCCHRWKTDPPHRLKIDPPV
jgi:hypothetical protein